MGQCVAAKPVAGRIDAVRMESLDGLRGIAAIAVLLHHVRLPPTGFIWGYLAVDFFFLLSGYVIGTVYEARFQAGLGVRAYMLQRLERLYPMIIIGGLLGLLCWSIAVPTGYFGIEGEVGWFAVLVSFFLLVPFTASRTAYVHNPAQWSIMFELCANLFHAVFYRWLKTWMLAVIVGLGFLALLVIADRHWVINYGWGVDNAHLGVPRVVFSYFLGVLLFRLEKHWIARVPVLPAWFPALLLFCLLGQPSTTISQLFNHYRDPLIIGLAFPALLMLGRVSTGFGKASRALGGLSYPLYLVQGGMLTLGEHLLARVQIGSGGAFYAVLLAGGAIVVGVSYLLGIYVDEPLNAWRRKTRRRRMLAAAPFAGPEPESGLEPALVPVPAPVLSGQAIPS